MFNSVLTLLSAGQIREYYAGGFWRDETIYSAAKQHKSRTPDKTAVRDRFRAISYKTLIHAADRLAAELHARGVKPGERVAVWLPSSH